MISKTKQKTKVILIIIIETFIYIYRVKAVSLYWYNNALIRHYRLAIQYAVPIIGLLLLESLASQVT